VKHYRPQAFEEEKIVGMLKIVMERQVGKAQTRGQQGMYTRCQREMVS
jgi:hypothetical protein